MLPLVGGLGRLSVPFDPVDPQSVQVVEIRILGRFWAVRRVCADSSSVRTVAQGGTYVHHYWPPCTEPIGINRGDRSYKRE